MVLKRRICVAVLYDGEVVFKGTKFGSWRSIGHVRQAAEVYAAREVDEVIFFDIGATPAGREPDFDLIRDITEKCFGPVTIGGGICSVEHFRLALANGADKVCICAAARSNQALITKAAERFGSQAVVVCIEHDGDRHVDATTTFATTVAALGAGEIILNNIDRDGTLKGYDLKTIAEVSAAVHIPVVALGGCGSYQDMADAFIAGADAVAAGACFVWEDMTPAGAAEYLHAEGFAVRKPGQ